MEDIADTANIKSSRQPAMAEIAVIAASVLPTFLMCDARLYSFCSLSAFSRSSDSVMEAGCGSRLESGYCPEGVLPAGKHPGQPFHLGHVHSGNPPPRQGIHDPYMPDPVFLFIPEPIRYKRFQIFLYHIVSSHFLRS